MNDNIESAAADAPDERIEGAELVPAPAVGDRQVITDTDALSGDDLTSAPIGDAKVHEPPVRSALPDEPVAHGVGVGQGAHQPPDPGLFDRDGRPRKVVESNVDVPGGGGDAPLDAEPGDNDGDEPHDDADVQALVENNDRDELVEQARERDLPVSGSKPELAERIVEHDRQNA